MKGRENGLLAFAVDGNALQYEEQNGLAEQIESRRGEVIPFRQAQNG